MSERETEVLRERAVVLGASEVLVPGTAAGSWHVESLIAMGGCGAVYAARHPVLDRTAAVKVLSKDLTRSQSMVNRFVQEARAVNRIRHPNIVDIFDFGMLPDGRPFLVMELLATFNLEDRIVASGRFRLDEALEIVRPICEALDAAHQAGYIHRDLKARNIGFTDTPYGAGVPKVLDFGVAKLLEDERDGVTSTIRVGTPHCMAPEQIRGERVDARTDVYAVGVLLHQLLTGVPPFDAPTALEIERMHVESPPPPPSRLAPVSVMVDNVVLRALAKDRCDRYPSIRHLLDDLIAVAATPASTVDDAREAIAIRVSVDIAASFDDDDLDAAAVAMDSARTLVSAAGFAPVVATGTSLLAVRVIDADKQAAEDDANRLVAFLRHATGTTTNVALRTGSATVRRATGEVVGGELLEPRTWRAHDS